MKKNDHPLVSVIIPAYNAEQFIEQTIRSVINQSYQNLECFIIDDGSPDELGTIAKRLSNEDSRIKYIRQENGGVSSARNNGIKLSKGNYICFLDADDFWSKDHVKYLLESIKKSDSIGLAHSDMILVNSDSKPTGKIKYGLSGKVLDDILLWEKCVIPAPSSIIIKKEVINQIGYFNTDLSTAADQEFFFRVAANYNVLRIKGGFGYYRVHDKNMSNNVLLLQNDHIKAYNIANRLGFFKSTKFKRKCFSNLYLIIAGNWWKNEGNKTKGTFYIFKSIFLYPPNINKLLLKLIVK